MWYTIAYQNEYGDDLAHTFSGNRDTLLRVMDAYRIDPSRVLTFAINDDALDIHTYLRGEENG